MAEFLRTEEKLVEKGDVIFAKDDINTGDNWFCRDARFRNLEMFKRNEILKRDNEEE